MSKKTPLVLKTEAFEMYASHEQPAGRDLALYGSGDRLYTAEEWQWMELALKILEKTMPHTVKQGHRGIDRQTVKNVRDAIRKRRNAYDKFMRESVR